MKTQSQHTKHATSSMTEINALPHTPEIIQAQACDLQDLVEMLCFISSEMKQIKELLGILADDNISAQLEPKQKLALAQTMLFKCEYLADFAYADAQRLNEHLKGTSHHKDFSQNAKP